MFDHFRIKTAASHRFNYYPWGWCCLLNLEYLFLILNLLLEPMVVSSLLRMCLYSLWKLPFETLKRCSRGDSTVVSGNDICWFSHSQSSLFRMCESSWIMTFSIMKCVLSSFIHFVDTCWKSDVVSLWAILIYFCASSLNLFVKGSTSDYLKSLSSFWVNSLCYS